MGNQYEVCNRVSSTLFGIYWAGSEDEAIEACCREAGYDSKADAEIVMGHASELIATAI